MTSLTRSALASVLCFQMLAMQTDIEISEQPEYQRHGGSEEKTSFALRLLAIVLPTPRQYGELIHERTWVSSGTAITGVNARVTGSGRWA